MMSKELHYILSEGLISKSRSKSIRLLNKRLHEILIFTKDIGLEAEPLEASDNMQYLFSRLDIQLGHNKLFKKSQVMSVTIYDVDDCTVELPVAVSIVLDIDNYKKIRGLREIKVFLKNLKSKLDTKLGSMA